MTRLFYLLVLLVSVAALNLSSATAAFDATDSTGGYAASFDLDDNADPKKQDSDSPDLIYFAFSTDATSQLTTALDYPRRADPKISSPAVYFIRGPPVFIA